MARVKSPKPAAGPYERPKAEEAQGTVKVTRKSGGRARVPKVVLISEENHEEAPPLQLPPAGKEDDQGELAPEEGPSIPSHEPAPRYSLSLPEEIDDLPTLASDAKRQPPSYFHPHTYLPTRGLPSNVIVNEVYQNMMTAIPRLQSQIPQLMSLAHPSFLGQHPELSPYGYLPPPPFPTPGSSSSNIVTPAAVFPKPFEEKKEQRQQHPSREVGKFSVFKAEVPETFASPQESVKKAKARNLPKAAVEHLKNWLIQHSDQPYPSEEEKERLAKELGITVAQINNWFINGRRRILQSQGIVYEKKKGSEAAWNHSSKDLGQEILLTHIEDVTQKTNGIIDSVLGPQTPSPGLQKFNNSLDWVRSDEFESHLLEAMKEGLEQVAIKKPSNPLEYLAFFFLRKV